MKMILSIFTNNQTSKNHSAFEAGNPSANTENFVLCNSFVFIYSDKYIIE